MAFLSEIAEGKDLREWKERLDRRLRYYGLKTVHFSDTWEVHGPHGPWMPYEVFIGMVQGLPGTSQAKYRRRNCFYVAMYPNGVYWIEDSSQWGKVPEQRLQRERKQRA